MIPLASWSNCFLALRVIDEIAILQSHNEFTESTPIRISQDGVDGSGPLYERVAAIADDWLKEHGLA